mmetsp:Transcript_10317/g.24116  ORF Transcript_10317/g.24116 Transcript_10317/m.24116 type:complete len:313 (-) Transcript_10317:212-1150(-)
MPRQPRPGCLEPPWPQPRSVSARQKCSSEGRASPSRCGTPRTRRAQAPGEGTRTLSRSGPSPAASPSSRQPRGSRRKSTSRAASGRWSPTRRRRMRRTSQRSSSRTGSSGRGSTCSTSPRPSLPKGSWWLLQTFLSRFRRRSSPTRGRRAVRLWRQRSKLCTPILARHRPSGGSSGTQLGGARRASLRGRSPSDESPSLASGGTRGPTRSWWWPRREMASSRSPSSARTSPRGRGFMWGLLGHSSSRPTARHRGPCHHARRFFLSLTLPLEPLEPFEAVEPLACRATSPSSRRRPTTRSSPTSRPCFHWRGP